MMKVKSCRDAVRAISQLHENEKLLAWVQSRRMVAWLTPIRRRQALFLGALLAGMMGLLHRHAPWRDYLTATTWLAPAAAMPLLLGLVYLCYLSATHFRRLPAPVRRRPQLSLHMVFWLMVAAIWMTPEEAGLWRTVLALIALSLPYLLWRCGYMLMSGQRGRAAGTSFRDHLFYLWPIWGGTNTPAGKGWDYLSQCEAQSAQAYARSGLAGIKLLILSGLWELSLLLLGGLVYADAKNSLTALVGGYGLGIPRLKRIANGEVAASWLTTWASLYFELVWDTLIIAARGHQWIGVLRLFGFNVFRNTYKPLLAESIIDFWNRYYYYFKELLVEFFFFPTYARCFRKSLRLRMLAAVFAAAFVGNMYYHLLQAKNDLIAGQWAELWGHLGPRLFYCALLSLGIYFSMLRQQKQRGKVGAGKAGMADFRKLRRIAGVWTFFSLINLWDIRSSLTILGRARFLFSLFGF